MRYTVVGRLGRSRVEVSWGGGRFLGPAEIVDRLNATVHGEPVRLQAALELVTSALDEVHELRVDVRDSRVAPLRFLDASLRQLAYAHVLLRPPS
jgi:hypothetical protein